MLSDQKLRKGRSTARSGQRPSSGAEAAAAVRIGGQRRSSRLEEAERAVRARVALIDALAGLETPAGEPLSARVGIATGLVMVGELIGEGAAREKAVVGETPNLAARLQTLAARGSVVISQATRRLLGGLFELADLGPVRVKGFAAPLIAWRVAGESQTEGRFEARQSAGLTPLVGREEEIALLLRRWQQAKDGEGHVVLMSGEPGIGKSRLVRELRARLADEPHVCSTSVRPTTRSVRGIR